jgi:hypothetical protein
MQNPTDQAEAPIPPEIVSSSSNMTASSSPNMNPTDQAEAPIPPETGSNDPIPPETGSNDANMNRSVKVRRKAAKRTFPFDLTIEELNVVPHIPARKKRRLEESHPTTRVRTR